MPAATSLSEIKNFNDAIERMLYMAQQAAGGKPVSARSAEDNAEDVWVVGIFQQGPASGHLIKRPDGLFDYDMFDNCQLGFDISIPRVPNLPMSLEMLVATYTRIGAELSRVRMALDPAQWPALNAHLPFHHITRLKPLGVPVFGFDSERMEDRAEIRYTCTLGVLPDAWPTDRGAYTNFQ